MRALMTTKIVTDRVYFFGNHLRHTKTANNNVMVKYEELLDAKKALYRSKQTQLDLIKQDQIRSHRWTIEEKNKKMQNLMLDKDSILEALELLRPIFNQIEEQANLGYTFLCTDNCNLTPMAIFILESKNYTVQNIFWGCSVTVIIKWG